MWQRSWHKWLLFYIMINKIEMISCSRTIHTIRSLLRVWDCEMFQTNKPKKILWNFESNAQSAINLKISLTIHDKNVFLNHELILEFQTFHGQSDITGIFRLWFYGWSRNVHVKVKKNTYFSQFGPISLADVQHNAHLLYSICIWVNWLRL